MARSVRRKLGARGCLVSRATLARVVGDPHAGRYAPRSGSKHCHPSKGRGRLVSSLRVDSRHLSVSLSVSCGSAELLNTPNSGSQFPVLRFGGQGFGNRAAASAWGRKLPRPVLP